MKQLGMLVALLFAVESYAQDNIEFIFQNDNVNDVEKPIIDDSRPLFVGAGSDAFVPREVVIAEGYFRRIRNHVQSEDPARMSRVLIQLEIDESQAHRLVSHINTWIERSGARAQEQKVAMCDYWSSPGLSKTLTSAHEAVNIYERNSKSISEVNNELTLLMSNVEQDLGPSVADRIMQGLDKDFAGRKNMSYSTFPNTVRARGNVIADVEFVCGDQS